MTKPVYLVQMLLLQFDLFVDQCNLIHRQNQIYTYPIHRLLLYGKVCFLKHNQIWYLE